MKVHHRQERFESGKEPNIRLCEVTEVPNCVRIEDDPYADMGTDALIDQVMRRDKWRYHHDIDALQTSPRLYAAYARRVETMMQMIDQALSDEQLLDSLPDRTATDLACAEGFFAMRYLGKGLRAIDCYELNIDQIERLKMVRAIKKITGMRLFRCDLESATWSAAINRTYDLVFCLGIIYHFENPMLFLRNLYEIASDVCVIESDTPLVGSDKQGILVQNESQVTKQAGDVRYILELRPNRKALVDMLLAVGFSSVRVLTPPRDAQCKYLKNGEKSVLFVRK